LFCVSRFYLSETPSKIQGFRAVAHASEAVIGEAHDITIFCCKDKVFMANNTLYILFFTAPPVISPKR
jgi:hypothetical protein